MNQKQKMLCVGIIVILLFSFDLEASRKEDSKSSIMAIIGGILLDIRTGRELNNFSIIVEGNRIKEVGSSEQITIPPSAEVLDISGKWVLPGLVDMHFHIGDEETNTILDLFLANGITTIRDAGGNITLLRLLRNAIDSQVKIGPRIFFSGQILDGNPPLWPDLSLLVETEQQAKSAVEFLVHQGVDFIKVYNSITEPVLKAIIEAAHAHNLPVVGHIPRSMTMSRAVKLGMKGLEHVRITGKEFLSPEEANRIDFLPYATRETLLWKSLDLDSREMQRLIKLLVDYEVFLDPTLSAAEETFILTPEFQIENPNNQYLPSQIFKSWKEWYENLENEEIYRVPPELKKDAVEGFKKRKRFVGMCAQAGVQILAGTDGPGLGTMLPGFGLHHELELLVEAGLTTLQAIQSATLLAAHALNQEKEIGSLEIGKFADLVILNANPLDKISNIAQIHLVMKDGRIFDPTKMNVRR
jgi:imidazolonepropionase-like amidohydrolase